MVLHSEVAACGSGLRPELAGSTHAPHQHSRAPIPAWHAIEQTQRRVAPSYLLISQPDHAALAGALAAAFVSPKFPRIDPLMARAIELHDSGWAIFDCEANPAIPPALDARSKPLSFVDISPADFVRAWTASIDRCEEVCPAGGWVVSGHFSRLARYRLNSVADVPADAALLHHFLDQEDRRCRRLRPSTADADLERCLEVLQFCDLLSLYLCCGADAKVEFPQRFASGPVILRRENGSFRLQPSPFQPDGSSDPSAQGLSVAVTATHFSASAGRGHSTTLAFLLW